MFMNGRVCQHIFIRACRETSKQIDAFLRLFFDFRRMRGKFLEYQDVNAAFILLSFNQVPLCRIMFAVWRLM